MTAAIERKKWVRIPDDTKLYMRQRAEAGATLQEISSETQVPPGTVWKHVHELIKNKPQPKGRQDISIQDVLDSIDQLGSQRQAAKRLGCSPTVVRQRL